jgi:hypothetical protein
MVPPIQCLSPRTHCLSIIIHPHLHGGVCCVRTGADNAPTVHVPSRSQAGKRLRQAPGAQLLDGSAVAYTEKWCANPPLHRGSACAALPGLPGCPLVQHGTASTHQSDVHATIPYARARTLFVMSLVLVWYCLAQTGDRSKPSTLVRGCSWQHCSVIYAQRQHGDGAALSTRALGAGP